MKIALFPGTFDPFTRGHEAIVEEALRLFDKVVIAIGENIGKKSLLTVEKRLQLIEEVYAGNPRVECIAYSSLTGDVAHEVGAQAIIRGLRNTIDFEYERTLADVNRRIFPDLTTLLLFTPTHLSDISSSTIRELLAFGCDVSDMLPEGIDIDFFFGEITKNRILLWNLQQR